MTDPLAIPASDRHTLRLFALDMARPELDRLTRPDPADTAAQADRAALLTQLLGLPDLGLPDDTSLDPDFVEVFDTADLGDLGLTGYLAEGGNIPDAQIAPDRDRLDALNGPVLVLFSRALQGKAATLRPDPRLTLIGTYTEDVPPVHFEPLPSAMAKGTLTPSLPRQAPTRLPRAFLLLGAAVLITGLVAVLLAFR
jgi:hypothetical protein